MEYFWSAISPIQIWENTDLKNTDLDTFYEVAKSEIEIREKCI